MKLRTVLFLIVALAIAVGTGGTFAQTPRPTNSLDGPLPVTFTGAVQVSPASAWAGPDGSAKVFITGGTAKSWSYDQVCLAQTASPWAELDGKGRDGWELVGSSGITCMKAGVNGMWFLLKRPSAK